MEASCEMVQLDVHDEDVISLLDNQFRDYSILAKGIEHRVADRIVVVPFFAPNWTIPTPGSEILGDTKPQFVIWLLEVRSVDAVSINYSESTALTEFDLGTARVLAPFRILIEAHYILTILIECSELNIRLYKAKLGS